MSYEPHNLSELETKIVCHYLTKLEKHGWVVKYADDGGFDYEQLNSMDDALAVIDSVEVSMIFFFKSWPGYTEHHVRPRQRRRYRGRQLYWRRRVRCPL